ncbi:hypothetical protein B0S90_1644 [Caldicellulosiruptor bescii]|uniref:Uncharacterized protein n=2 Tax=Caldicellulosiruptor bescii TaxID=31899 RepID=B9MRZ7_CALBD|nr:hypothetical protein Athe_1351 [Caldicellulosiruptor bescii DSM 6725]PBC87865.1 hypothetical protein B0S87_0784 [Caldicellulosiruptor bescii]PBC90797.1 hypothetical protein B0S89_1146 [Caldicellulosiruptor bescii]PBD03770.1 hypothetical protein B0S85_1393 [Caldicellulosiruptor bescii]PBD06595.1 hypothetical protein B0S90_1644 [Caldicellulosiruptor bescii]
MYLYFISDFLLDIINCSLSGSSDCELIVEKLLVSFVEFDISEKLLPDERLMLKINSRDNIKISHFISYFHEKTLLFYFFNSNF